MVTNINALVASVVVPTMNRARNLAALLESIRTQSHQPAELIIVDQSTDNKTKEVCAEYEILFKTLGCSLRYFQQSQPSLVAARNRGAQEAAGEIVCFLDDDIRIDPEYFERMLPYFNDPNVGGIAGNPYQTNTGWWQGPKWEIRKFLMRMFLINNFNGTMTASGFGYAIFEWEIDRVHPVEFFGGYSMNFRKNLLLKEPCDEWFTGYGFREDMDLSYRISRHAKLLMVPDARFYHDSSPVNRLDLDRLKKMQFRNYWYFYKKFKRKSFFTDALFFYSLSGIVFLELIEWLSGFRREKWLALKASFYALRSDFTNV